MRAKFINEKFKEESDPITDMGIGLSFLNLKPGMILKAIKEVKIANRTQFSSQGPRKIMKGNYVVVLKAERTQLNDKIKVWYYQTWDSIEARHIGNAIDSYSLGNSMTGSEKQFENRFKIIR